MGKELVVVHLCSVTGPAEVSERRAAWRCAYLGATVCMAVGCRDAAAPAPTHHVSVQIGSRVTGRLALAMSTGFQPASYDAYDFQGFPGAVGPLAALHPQHIRIQSISDGNPQTSPSTWNFTDLDAATQPILTVGDHSPELQLGQAPLFMYNASGYLLDTTFQEFVAYATQMVRYYNAGGFTAPDGKHASPSPYHITWWGIYNEPNINNLTTGQYAELYNKTVPAMQAVDPTLRFVAGEVTGDLYTLHNYLPGLLEGLTARVDAVAIHLYSMCNQATPDALVMQTVPTFATSVQTTEAVAAFGPLTASAPIWITENNVNADYNVGNGISACNGNTYVPDARGSSAFFAAWRPYVFSKVGQAGAQALYHWSFFGDITNAEVNRTSDADQLPYWVDYWLARAFPSPPGANILAVTNSDTVHVEVLAARNDSGGVAILVDNHAVASVNDNNGKGAPSEVTLDLSALGSFRSGEMVTIDARTDPSDGPTPMSFAPSSTMTVLLPGYGVTFLTMK
jgi:hypothetical protein